MLLVIPMIFITLPSSCSIGLFFPCGFTIHLTQISVIPIISITLYIIRLFHWAVLSPWPYYPYMISRSGTPMVFIISMVFIILLSGCFIGLQLLSSSGLTIHQSLVAIFSFFAQKALFSPSNKDQRDHN